MVSFGKTVFPAHRVPRDGTTQCEVEYSTGSAGNYELRQVPTLALLPRQRSGSRNFCLPATGEWTGGLENTRLTQAEQSQVPSDLCRLDPPRVDDCQLPLSVKEKGSWQLQCVLFQNKRQTI